MRMLFVFTFVLGLMAGYVAGGADDVQAGPCDRNPELCR